MKLSSEFLILFIIKIALCKNHQKHTYDSKSLEGDTLIGKILSSGRFHELADKIVDKAIDKIYNRQSAVVNLPSKNLEIESKKSNVNPNPEFKSKKDVKPEKRSKKSQERYKPGKINIEAVMQKKIRPSDDLTFRYNRFTRRDRITTGSDKPQPKQDNAERASDFNLVNENEESTTKHKVIKKPSANDDSEEQNKSDTGTDEESKSEEKDNLKTNTSSNLGESTKFTDLYATRTTNLQSDGNPLGNEKDINWKGRHSDKDETDDSEDKSEAKGTEKVEKTSPQVTAKITEGKTEAVKNIHHLFRAETEPTTTSEHTIGNKVDDDYDDGDVDHGDGQKDTRKTKQGEIQSKTKQIIRREGDRTYVLKESSDYQEYHEQLAKMRKAQP